MVSKRLYLGGLPNFVSGEQVAKYFASYGKVIEVKLHDDYGFVEFAAQRDATDVLKTYNEQSFLGAPITVEYAHPRRDSMETKESGSSPAPRGRLAPTNARIRYPVVVTNISRSTCWQELKDFGRVAGGIVAYCDVDKSRQGRGFIEYLSQEDADEATRHLNGRELCGNIVGVAAYNGRYNYHEGSERPRSRSASPRRHSVRERSPHSSHEKKRSKEHKRRERKKEKSENTPLLIPTVASLAKYHRD